MCHAFDSKAYFSHPYEYVLPSGCCGDMRAICYLIRCLVVDLEAADGSVDRDQDVQPPPEHRSEQPKPLHPRRPGQSRHQSRHQNQVLHGDSFPSCGWQPRRPTWRVVARELVKEAVSGVERVLG